jgi:hypothetical protein
MSENNYVVRSSLTALLKRRSVSSKRLGSPGLTHEQLECVMHAALRARPRRTGSMARDRVRGSTALCIG